MELKIAKIRLVGVIAFAGFIIAVILKNILFTQIFAGVVSLSFASIILFHIYRLFKNKGLFINFTTTEEEVTKEED